jgi:hypothetical protein
MSITNYKDMKVEDIINWCVANNQVPWLQAKALETRPYKVYPKVKVDGKMKADKTQEPVIEQRPISFIQLKLDFVNEFFPELAPVKEKKQTMYDLIKNL